MIKRFLLTLAVIFTAGVPVAITTSPALAVDVLSHCGQGSANGTPDVCTDANNQTGNNGSNNPIVDIIKSAIEVLSYIIGIAAIIGIIVSGIRLMTAGGDANAVASARTGIAYSLVGVAAAALAQVLVAYVLDKVK